VSHRRGGRVACGRHRPSPPGRTRRNRGPSVRTLSQPRRSGGSPCDIRLASTPLGLSQRPDHGAGDRREEDLRPAVAATLPGRAATGGHGRRRPHVRATGRGGAGRPPPSEHADVMKAGRRARRRRDGRLRKPSAASRRAQFGARRSVPLRPSTAGASRRRQAHRHLRARTRYAFVKTAVIQSC
jgi:hypothetical protein